jgi:AraC-like DNA-binding protein
MQHNNARLPVAGRTSAPPGQELTTVRIGPICAVPAVLQSLGQDPAVVLGEIGIDPRLFDDPDNLISYAVRGRILGHCAAKTGCRHFGLLIGARGGLQGFGIVGLLAKYSTDVATALQRLVGFLHLHVRGAGAALSVEGDLATLRYDILQPNVEAVDQLGEGAVATMFKILRGLCGSDWRPIEIRLAHRAPPNLQPYRAYFGVTPTFDAAEYAVVFEASWLSRPVPEGDAELIRLLQQHILTLGAKHEGNLVAQVRAILRAAILAGHAGEEQIAALLSLHKRTMHRRLVAEGTQFRVIDAECRYDIARQLLEHSALAITEIAGTLGYAEASVFNRAFRRWSGTTPTRWREQHRHS